MRIAGLPEGVNLREETVVDLRRKEHKVQLTVRALQSDFMTDSEKEIPSPVPPRLGISRDKKGRIDRDPATGRPVMLYDEEDHAYIAAASEAKVLQTFKLIVDALDPSEVTFEAKRDDFDTAAEFYQACRREMDALGFSIADYTALAKAVADVSDISEEDLAVAEAGFFEKGSSRTATESSPSPLSLE